MLHTTDIDLPKAFRELLTKNARYKGWWSGRGCAKSWSFATAAVIRAAQHGWLFLCCREHQKSIRESVKTLLDNQIMQLGVTEYFHSTANAIGAKSGGGFLFEGLANNVHGIRSKEGVHAAWVEEAATVKQSSLDILIPTIRKPKSELWFSWNPRFDNDPVDKMLRGEGSEQTDFDRELAEKSGYDEWQIVRQVTVEENKFFPDVLRAEMERDRRRDPDRYEHIWRGGYAHQSESRVFRNWKIDTMDVPKHMRPYYGADWGFAVDPCVLVRCFVFEDKRMIYIDAEVSDHKVDIDTTPKFFDSIVDVDDEEDAIRLHPRKWPLKADSSRPEIIAYMHKNGYPRIEGARKGAGSVEEGVLFLKSYDIVIHPRCKKVIDEFTHYSYETDPLTNEVLPTLADEHNHTIDAVRYAVEAIRRALSVKARPMIIRTPRVYFGDNVGS